MAGLCLKLLSRPLFEHPNGHFEPDLSNLAGVGMGSKALRQGKPVPTLWD